MLALALVAGATLGCQKSGPCFDGARLQGKAPPAGTLEWCAKPDGVKHGHWKEWWHDTSTLKSEGQYRNGSMDGHWVTYFKSGKKEWEGVYRDGLKDGVWTLSYEDEGTKNREEVHIAGSWEVKWTAWRSGGQKWASGATLGSQHQGEYKEWHTNGQLAVQGSYDEHGQKAGQWKYWLPDGTATDVAQGEFGK